MVNVWRVTTELSGVQGAPYYSTFHFDPLAPGTSPSACLVATQAFWTGLDAFLAPTLIATTNREVAVIDVDTDTQVGMELATGSNTHTFHGSGERLPWATQGLVRWRTSTFVGGRELRGRTFIPAFAETANAGGTVEPTVTSAVDLVAADLVTDPDALFVVYSPTHHVIAPPIFGSMWNQWAELRTRRD